jgi:hypothetical protein
MPACRAHHCDPPDGVPVPLMHVGEHPTPLACANVRRGWQCAVLVLSTSRAGSHYRNQWLAHARPSRPSIVKCPGQDADPLYDPALAYIRP